MNTCVLNTPLRFIAIVFVLLIAATSLKAQGGIGLSPNLSEVIVPAGTEKTFGLTLDYNRDTADAQMPTARIVARLEDWSVLPNGDVRTGEIGSVERSAAKWVTFGPSEVTLAPDTKQVIRFTVSVPKETKPGDYYFAVYVEDRNPPPPPKEGERKLYVRYRLYSLIFVEVPGLTREGELANLKAEMRDGRLEVIPTLRNKGNSHVKPKHSIEIRDEAGKLFTEIPMEETRAVLGGNEIEIRTPVNADLPVGKYKVSYKVDFGENKPILAAKTGFEVTETDIAERKKVDEAETANSGAPNSKQQPNYVSPMVSKAHDGNLATQISANSKAGDANQKTVVAENSPKQ